MHIESLIQLLITYRYAMLLVLALIEGPLVCLGAGVMIRFGYFAPIPAFAIVMIGDILPNSVSFFLGKFGNQKKLMHTILQKLHITQHHLDLLETFWVTHTHKTMFSAKLAWGLGVPLFMSAGMTTLSFKKFLASMTWIAFVQYLVIISLGYYLAHSYTLITTSNGYIENIGLICSFVIVILILVSMSRFAKNKLLGAQEKA